MTNVSPTMTFSINYDPNGFVRRSRLISATTALDVEINNIRSKIYDTVYQINLNDYIDYIEIEFVDRAGHKNHIEIYDSVHHCCDCENYCRSGTGTCKHLEILKLINKSPMDKNERNFIAEIQRYSARLDKNPKSKNYVFYNGLTREVLRIKSDEEFLDRESMNIATYRKLHRFNYTEDPNVNFTDNYKLPNIELYDYQTEILQKLLTVKRGLCSMVMGSGKTLLSIGGIHYLQDPNVLIVCPKSIAGQWQTEISKHLGYPSVIASTKNLSTIPDDTITIVSYQTFMKNVDFFKKKQYKLCIADEIQYIRNDESKVWSAFRKINSEYFWGLSGTIIENRLDDLYNIFEIVRPGALGPKWLFDSKYKPVQSVHNMKILYENKIQNLKQLREEISGCVFSYDDLELPTLHKHVIRVDMTDGVRRMHDDFVQQAKMLVAKGLSRPLSFKERALIQAYYLRARQCCNTSELVDEVEVESPKISAVMKKIQELIDLGHNVVVYSEWTSMLDIIERKLLSSKIPFHRYDGSMNIQQRQQAIANFQSSKATVFTSSDAGSIGVDGLQTCSNHLIHVELPWNPAKLDQRNGRLHRIKQDKDVHVYNFICNNSIETKIEGLLRDKKKIRYEALYE